MNTPCLLSSRTRTQRAEPDRVSPEESESVRRRIQLQTKPLPRNWIELTSCSIHRSLGMIDPGGIEKLCSDMEVDHTDVRILMVAWKMQAEQQGYFTLMQTDYTVINMDQWMGFYRFCNKISFPEFSNYDPDLAWPLILDSFVEWMKAKQS